MGGRKGDVKRKQKPHNKRLRPLSAVIEEHEADDSVPKINHHDTDCVKQEKSDDRKPAKIVASSCESVGTCLNRATSSDSSSHASSQHAASDTPSSNPRRNSSRSGRRQALTPSFSPLLNEQDGAGQVLTSWFSVDHHHHDNTDSDDDTLDPSDMTRLRQTAERLHLSTRRPSVLQWRAQYVECPEFPLPPGNSGEGDVTGGDVTGQNGDGGEGRWTAERTERINTALDWIINELQEMRTQDQQLARQLLTIRSDLHQLKLARSCEEHQDMLDDVQSELEELQEFADVLDLPTPTIADSPLKHLGVTRMNFSARRFSTC